VPEKTDRTRPGFSDVPSPTVPFLKEITSSRRESDSSLLFSSFTLPYFYTEGIELGFGIMNCGTLTRLSIS